MVAIVDFRITERQLHEVIDPVSQGLRIGDPLDYFASIVWSVICEPGDAFAGKLIGAFGSAQALAFELADTDAHQYVKLFEEQGVDFAALQTFGKFERAQREARERWKPRMSITAVSEATATANAVGGWFINADCDGWPIAFESLQEHTPRGLWCRGRGEALHRLERAVSMVGSRMATSYGEFATGDLVGALVERDYCIVSGGAYGIDSMAHKSALALNSATVAVMAGGLDRLYPAGHIDLFRKIEESGILISEMPPGSEPTKWRFLQRNRLIAALGDATVVVEANPRSGAVSTANRALELGKPLGAVPGPINSPGSDGCHQLIRDMGAELITSGDDILRLLGQSTGQERAEERLGALETRVLDVIGFKTATFEKICNEGGLTRDEARIGLAGLSLAGLIEEFSAGWRRR